MATTRPVAANRRAKGRVLRVRSVVHKSAEFVMEESNLARGVIVFGELEAVMIFPSVPGKRLPAFVRPSEYGSGGQQTEDGRASKRLTCEQTAAAQVIERV